MFGGGRSGMYGLQALQQVEDPMHLHEAVRQTLESKVETFTFLCGCWFNKLKTKCIFTKQQGRHLCACNPFKLDMEKRYLTQQRTQTGHSDALD